MFTNSRSKWIDMITAVKNKVIQRTSEEAGRNLMKGCSHSIFMFLNKNMRRHNRGIFVKPERSESPTGSRDWRSLNAELERRGKAQMCRSGDLCDSFIEVQGSCAMTQEKGVFRTTLLLLFPAASPSCFFFEVQPNSKTQELNL